MLPVGFAALVAASLSTLTLVALRVAGARLPHAHPNARSLHSRPVPRVGGIAIWVGFVPVALLGAALDGESVAWLAAWLAVLVVSLVDDWRGVRPIVRLVVQVLAATAVTTAFVGAPRTFDSSLTDAIVRIAIVGGLVWGANLYNFMDGSDGLAALMAIIGFGTYGAAALMAGLPAERHFALAAATIPFLVVNLPPARAFMGDVGSVPLGFLAGAFGVQGVVGNTWPGWFPLLVFLPFVADATVTLALRVMRREPVFEAHKLHYYQRLNRMGAGHGGTLFVYAVLIVGSATSALFTLLRAPAAGWAVFGGWALAVGLLFAGIDYHWHKRFSK